MNIELYEKSPFLENNFTVNFMEFSFAAYFPPHCHEHIELLFFLSGKCRFTCHGKGFSIQANEFVIVIILLPILHLNRDRNKLIIRCLFHPSFVSAISARKNK